MAITIEKHIPAPVAPEKPDNKVTKSDLNSMEVGDSCLTNASDRTNLASLISHVFHSDYGKRFKISSKDLPKGQIRVWRIEDEEKPVSA
jgi:hypothetical protein